MDRWLFLVGIITCINSACGVHLSVVPISSYKRNNGRRRFKTGFRAGFPLCLEVFVVWEITPTQRSFPISTVPALLRKHISCSCRSTCSTKRTTERLSTHRRRRSLQAQVAQARGASWETCRPLDFIRICMGDYVPSRNSSFTEILKLKLPYLVSVCVSLPL